MSLYAVIITLFLVMNPLGNIPVFISTLQYVDPKRRFRIILREAFFALIILTLFLFAGHRIIISLQVSEPAFSMAGGIILFLIAIRLIFPPSKTTDSKPVGEPFLVPLAIPLFAGPATMTTAILISQQYPGKILWLFLALIIAWLLSSILLLLSSKLSKFLGESGLTALERLMGMILTTLSVQMFLTGIGQYFHLAH